MYGSDEVNYLNSVDRDAHISSLLVREWESLGLFCRAQFVRKKLGFMKKYISLSTSLQSIQARHLSFLKNGLVVKSLNYT